METKDTQQELLSFFKALADANRLKIVGLLAREPLSVEQMAEILGLHASTVSHHLSRLSAAGLVSGRAEGYYSVYRLETGVLESMAQRLLAGEELKTAAEELDVDAYDRKVLDSFLRPDGRIKSLPAQRKKLEVLLRYVAQAFQPGQRYTEKQVTEALSRYYHDTSSLRRGLIDSRIMERETGGGSYWLSSNKSQ